MNVNGIRDDDGDNDKSKIGRLNEDVDIERNGLATILTRTVVEMTRTKEDLCNGWALRI